jgi:nitroreductase
MMEVSDAIHGLRAVRRFSDRPIEPEQVRAIVDAGRLAPSSENSQTREFVVCTDRDHLKELARIGDWTSHLAGAAAGIAVVTPDSNDPEEREIVAFDAGQAVQNMLLAAWEMGIGGCHGSVYVESEARRLLGYPQGKRCDLIMSFGYPEQEWKLTRPRRAGMRRPYDDIVHEERW